MKSAGRIKGGTAYQQTRRETSGRIPVLHRARAPVFDRKRHPSARMLAAFMSDTRRSAIASVETAKRAPRDGRAVARHSKEKKPAGDGTAASAALISD